ncbi:Pentatricopeptide repeat-containing protein 10, partial [Durusdinium trenchii]
KSCHESHRRDFGGLQQLGRLRMQGKWQEALELWRLEGRLEAAACSEVLGVMVRLGSAREAAQLLRDMHDQTVQPNDLAIGRAISACVNGGAWEEAIKLLLEVELWHLRPNAVAYNAALGACGRASSAESALQLLKRMDQLQIQRTKRTYG